MANVVNTQPYIRTSWKLPDDSTKELVKELNRSYLEIANAINFRTIGIFPANRPALGGEQWFITSQRQNNFRQIYTFTALGNIPHGIDLRINAPYLTKCEGSFTDGNNWYGCIYASNVTIAGQVSFYVTYNSAPGVLDGNIVVIAGAGAPAITKGIIVLEWISAV